jgi:hypothetical protein
MKGTRTVEQWKPLPSLREAAWNLSLGSPVRSSEMLAVFLGIKVFVETGSPRGAERPSTRATVNRIPLETFRPNR